MQEQGGVLSLLLVEDNPLDAELSLEYLRNAGLNFTVHRTETREAFTAALQTTCPDLILADYSLPSFDGLTALSIALQECPDTPFIFVSGVMGEEVAADSLKHGATDFVLKQRLGRLVPAVKRALAETTERRDRKKAEEALRHSEERLRLALSTARLGVWELDLTSYQLDCSHTCKSNFGVSPEAEFTYGDLWNSILPEDREQVRSRVQQAIATRSNYQTEYRIRWPDGSIHWVLTNARVIEGRGDEPMRMAGVTLDITGRKQAEEDLRRQTRELKAANADLAQFAYAASHDLQEPLRTVSIFSKLLAKKYKGRLDAEADEFLEYLESAAQHMSALLGDLLTYTRVPADERAFQWTDLNAVLQRTLYLFRTVVEENNAYITQDELPCVFGNDAQLGLVFQNLISNALKYRNSRPPEIHVGVERQQEDWVITVQDNGIGFDQAYAEQIFGLFKRLHKREYSGTGLGLAITKRIIESHGGRIWAKSQPGVGSCFSFTIPVAPDDAKPQPSVC
jgi:PAS domain S-box-containing protein